MAKKNPFSLDNQDVFRKVLHEGWIGAILMDNNEDIKVFKKCYYDARIQTLEPEIAKKLDGEDELSFLFEVMKSGKKKLEIIYFADYLPSYSDIKDKSQIVWKWQRAQL